MSEDTRKWELVIKYYGDGDTHRLEVPGGWLYRYTVGSAATMVFVSKVSH